MYAHPAVQRTVKGLFHSSASAVYVFVRSCVLKSGRKRVTFPCWDLRAAVAMFLWPSVTMSELFLPQPKAWSHKHTHTHSRTLRPMQCYWEHHRINCHFLSKTTSSCVGFRQRHWYDDKTSQISDYTENNGCAISLHGETLEINQIFSYHCLFLFSI